MRVENKEDNQNDFVIENVSNSTIDTAGRDRIDNKTVITIEISKIFFSLTNPLGFIFQSFKGRALRTSEYANASFDTIWLLSYIILATIRAFGARDIQSPEPIHFAIILLFVGACFVWTAWTGRIMTRSEGLCGICQSRLIGEAYYCVKCQLPICSRCYDFEHLACKKCASDFAAM